MVKHAFFLLSLRCLTEQIKICSSLIYVFHAHIDAIKTKSEIVKREVTNIKMFKLHKPIYSYVPAAALPAKEANGRHVTVTVLPVDNLYWCLLSSLPLYFCSFDTDSSNDSLISIPLCNSSLSLFLCGQTGVISAHCSAHCSAQLPEIQL